MKFLLQFVFWLVICPAICIALYRESPDAFLDCQKCIAQSNMMWCSSLISGTPVSCDQYSYNCKEGFSTRQGSLWKYVLKILEKCCILVTLYQRQAILSGQSLNLINLRVYVSVVVF